ncbi:MAG: hypothetical protein P4M14_04955 [Gammaproteobacteria bacterium]|nr:hypothetical protein [Gammaproteobacteria bacterium]
MLKFNTKLNIVSLLLGTLFISSMAFAGALWQGTTSGMSINEVRATFPQLASTKPSEDVLEGQPVKLLHLDNIQIVGSLFSANFYFKDEKLFDVTLVLDGNSSYVSTMNVFGSLSTALRKKYGKEVSTNEKSGLVNQTDAEWLSQSTHIKLSTVSVSNDNAVLKLTYQTK